MRHLRGRYSPRRPSHMFEDRVVQWTWLKVFWPVLALNRLNAINYRQGLGICFLRRDSIELARRLHWLGIEGNGLGRRSGFDSGSRLKISHGRTGGSKEQEALSTLNKRTRSPMVQWTRTGESDRWWGNHYNDGTVRAKVKLLRNVVSNLGQRRRKKKNGT